MRIVDEMLQLLESFDYEKGDPRTPPPDEISLLKDTKPGDFIDVEGNKAIRTEDGYIALDGEGNIIIAKWNKRRWEYVTLHRELTPHLKRFVGRYL